MTKTDPRFPDFSCYKFAVGRSVAVTALLACGFALDLCAQQTSTPPPEKTSFVPVFAVDQVHPFDLASLPPLPFSLSSSSADSTVAEHSASGLDLAQPPPRRRYGRAHYNDKLHNADGSNKLAFIAGVGFEVPSDSVTRQYLKTGYKFQVGGGINFNKKLALLVQFDYDHFALPGSLITSQIGVYNSAGFVQQDQNGNLVPADFTQLDGNAHIWSFTLNPTYNFYQGDSLGAYVVVGGGFYHKVTDFTLPQTQVGFDPFFGPFQFTQNQTFDKYTSNSAGANGGIGITYKPSKFASERLYAEVRYVHTFNEQRPSTATNFNFFPGNSSTSSYIPITVGIRF